MKKANQVARRAATILAVSVFISTIASLPAATYREIGWRSAEQALTKKYKGTVITLANFYVADTLRFGPTGTPIHKNLTTGSYTVNGKLIIQKIRVNKSGYEIRAKRVYVGVISLSLELRSFKAKPRVRLFLTAETAKRSVEEFDRRLRQITLPRDRTLEDVLPTYWHPFLRGETMDMVKRLSAPPPRAKQRKGRKKGVKKEDEDVETAPVCLTCPNPYEKFDVSTNNTAAVTLLASLNEHGAIALVSPLAGNPPDTFLAVVREWKFRPATKNDSPASSRILIVWEEQADHPGEGRPFRIEDTDRQDFTWPMCVDCPEPAFNKPGREVKFNGTIIVEVVIKTDGRARIVRLIKPVGYGLDENAIRAIQRWSFRPQRFRGTSVPSLTTIEVSFSIY